MDSDSHHDNNEAELDDRIGDIVGIDSGKLKYWAAAIAEKILQSSLFIDRVNFWLDWLLFLTAIYY